MKTKICFLVCVFVFTNSIVFADVDVNLKLPSVSKFLGLGPKTIVSINNPTDFIASICASADEDEFIGDIYPGGSVLEKFTPKFDRFEIPVFARMYEWNNGKRGDFVGITGTILRVRNNEPIVWEIRTNEIIRLDGSRVFSDSRNFYRADAKIFDSREVKFPKIGLFSTTVLQFVNATKGEVEVRINGSPGVYLAQAGDFYSFSKWERYKRIPLVIEVFFYDRSRLIGKYEDKITVGSNDPDAYQYILDASKIRNY